ncbi:MAG: hypothetical protein IH864_04955 [Chloroflexi bacterium]|nr:hypothetical protein [Chloroflexota bacterium]
MTVVYFYPSDQEPNREYIAQIDGTMAGIQGWYGTQVGSTFSVDPVQVIRGQRNTANYGQGGEIWGAVLRELGYYCGTGIHVIFVHPSIPFTGGGSCDPTYESGSGGGTTMFMEGHAIGILAHELGHAFALPHPQGCGTTTEPTYCGDTVMWGWWGYPNVGLLDLKVAPEKQTLASSPFFSVPMEGGPDGTPDSTTDGTGDEPDTVAPTVNIVSPSDGARVKGRWLKVRAEGSDNVRVAEMELYIDSQLVFSTTGANLDYRWDMRGTARGSSLTVTVNARDEAGNSSAVQLTVSR